MLVGCAYPPSDPDRVSLDQRVLELERRMERLEASTAATPAAPSSEAIQAEIASLERERGQLLVRYYETHPSIVAIDRRLAVLRQQLAPLD